MRSLTHDRAAASQAIPQRSPWTRVGQALPRGVVILLTALAIFTPLALIFYQSFLSAPFFMPDALAGLDAYRFIFTDPDFWHAFEKSTALAFGLAVISVPLGGILAFLMVRSDLPGRRIIEPMLMIPVFVSPMVLAFGYVVSAGPVGFYTIWFKQLFGGAPWNVYSFTSIIIIAGLTHVPHVYLYVSSALRSLGSDVEEAARISGASPLSVALNVSLPMVRPALLYAAVLVIFLGFEVFGLVLVLGDPEGHLVLATYLYKLTNKLGTPAYHLMAAVAVCLVMVTFPLVLLQRYMLRSANRFVTVKGKVTRSRPLPLGKWRWPAWAVVVLWFFVTVIVPLSGIALRAFVSNWGEGVSLMEAISTTAFHQIFEQPQFLRAIINTVLIGVIGGALAVGCYTCIGLAMHRKPDGWTRVLDYSVLVPRAIPGLLAGLAFLWVFLFVPNWIETALTDSSVPFAGWMIEHVVPVLRNLRSTIFSVWIAYSVVWMAYGLRLISAALLQVGPSWRKPPARSAPRAPAPRAT